MGLIKSKINYVIERRVKKFIFENININLVEAILLKAKNINDKICQKEKNGKIKVNLFVFKILLKMVIRFTYKDLENLYKEKRKLFSFFLLF